MLISSELQFFKSNITLFGIASKTIANSPVQNQIWLNKDLFLNMSLLFHESMPSRVLNI